MAPAEIASENYAKILQFVAISLPPFLQDGGEPAIPLVAWYAAYNSVLVAYEYYHRVHVTDKQKNWLLLDRLGEQGMQRLDQHVDVLHMEGGHHASRCLSTGRPPMPTRPSLTQRQYRPSYWCR